MDKRGWHPEPNRTLARGSKVAWVGETVDAYLEDVIHDKVATEYDNEERHMHPPESES